ncbi:DegV family protein [Natroniella sulfidigena]|uniref:DegV family protein n=1 Tax=Natroniella sulfidigena TaxID=723921 RepID=UPI00200AF728|nr:DegV family protein [Natroniella sulfidigena]MCK8816790.1 DegV family protein [Natroniella sulfidigena]
MSESIAILTDSTSDLPFDLIQDKEIEFLPLKINYSQQQYRDRIEIKPEEIYDRFEEEIPTTSTPAPQELKEKLLALKKKGITHVLAIHISSGLSGTYNMVKMISEQITDLTVEVIDSKALSMGLGRLVLYATELLEAGVKFNTLVNKVKAKIDQIDIFFVLKTLKYLKEGGRIGKVEGALGSLLNIKPIISIDKTGEYYTYKKSRGRKRSLKKLYQIVSKKIAVGPCTIDVMHGNAADEAEDLVTKFKKLDNVKETFLGQISPVMVVHTGPGLIGVNITRLD